MKQKIKGLSKEKLQNIILEMAELLSEEQYVKLEALVEAVSGRKIFICTFLIIRFSNYILKICFG